MAGFNPKLDLPTQDDIVEAEMRTLDSELRFLLTYPDSTCQYLSDHFRQRRRFNW
jgi:hypothetical protein